MGSGHYKAIIALRGVNHEIILKPIQIKSQEESLSLIFNDTEVIVLTFYVYKKLC